MKNNYDVVIVGGGIAGLIAAAYLTKYNKSVILFEKEANIGGLVNTFEINGFSFDGGIRAFENSGILFPMLKNLGIEMEFYSSPVSIGIKDKWVKLESVNSISDYTSLLKYYFSNEAKEIDLIEAEIRKIVKYLDVLYGIDNPLFLEDMKDFKYLTQTLLPWLIKYKINIRKSSKLNQPVNDYLRKFTSNDALVDMITQHFFKDTPTNFALSYFGLYLDYIYPKGGTKTLIEKIEEYIIKNGGTIIRNAKVNQVNQLEKYVVVNEKDIYQYKKLVWAADQKTLYNYIVKDQSKSLIQQINKVEKSKGNDSILSLYIASNIPKEKIKNTFNAHGFYTPKLNGLRTLEKFEKIKNKDKEKLFEWLKSYLDYTTYEISCPVIRDESLAPNNQVGIIISTLMDYSIVDHFNKLGLYNELKQTATNQIIKIMDETCLVGLKDTILFSICSTPLTIERLTGNFQGAITGWAFEQNIPSENDFKKITHSINTPIKDILQCGQWTFSPSGLPISILSGKLVADQIKKDL